MIFFIGLAALVPDEMYIFKIWCIGMAIAMRFMNA